MNIKRVGVINWDSALPKETYFGGGMLNRLGNDKYCARLPYFAQKTESGYDFPAPTQEEYDRELEYARKYGVDFFVYGWYPENDGKEKNVGKEHYPFLVGKTDELNVKRRLYQSSKLKNKINYCAIIFDVHAYSEDEFDGLIDAMKDDHYEKIDGRPLVVIYLGGSEAKHYNGAVADCVKRKADKAGINPYFTLIAAANYDNSPSKPPRDYIDAVSLYAIWGVKAKEYIPLADVAIDRNERQKNFGIPVIPLISAGWNPMPRIDDPIPWADDYTDEYVEQLPDLAGFRYAFEKTEKWIDDNPDIANTGCAFVYAWNEFEEGGYICPTLGKDGTPDTSVAEAFFNARNAVD